MIVACFRAVELPGECTAETVQFRAPPTIGLPCTEGREERHSGVAGKEKVSLGTSARCREPSSRLAENKRRTLPGEATLRQQQVRKPRADDASIAADDVATPS